MHRTYKGEFKKLMHDKQYLLVGTNTQGRHGKGTALTGCEEYGLTYGHATGPIGRCYGIVTKDLTKHQQPSIPKEIIIDQIKIFYIWARMRTDYEMIIPYSGISGAMNLNRYTPREMAQMFIVAGEIPPNLVFQEDFYKEILTIKNPYALW